MIMRQPGDSRCRELLGSARPHDHHLTAENPVWATAAGFDASLPLEIHMHIGVEVGIILAGREELRFADTIIEAGPGDVWLVSMWEPHGWLTKEPGTTGVVVIFLPEFVGEALGSDFTWMDMLAVPPDQRPGRDDLESPELVRAIASDMYRQIGQQLPHWQLAVKLALARLLIELRRSWRPRGSRDARPDTNRLARLMPAILLASEDMQRKVTSQDAAAACGLSPSRFHHIFRQTLGLPFGRFQLRTRLAHAAHRLLTTDDPVETIAVETGFVDGSHLCRRFLSEYGCTPSDYRKRAQAERPAAVRP